jgi:hypothetical protein
LLHKSGFILLPENLMPTIYSSLMEINKMHEWVKNKIDE